LPEAQLDRFLFKLQVPYPSAEQEHTMLARHDEGLDPHDIRGAGVRAVATAADLARGRREIQAIRVDPALLAYIVSLCRATRESPSLLLGVSPRGATWLLHAAKAWAWLSGRSFVTPDEVKAVAKPCLRHRIIVKPELELEGALADGILDGILATVPTPR
jgi:MoxR-like ATPase